VVAFTAATIGFQHRRRDCPGDAAHIAGMGIGYIAMLTAFYVDNGPHLPLWDRLPTIAFWLLPSAIGHHSLPGQCCASAATGLQGAISSLDEREWRANRADCFAAPGYRRGSPISVPRVARASDRAR
jgi:hypothetical protein